VRSIDEKEKKESATVEKEESTFAAEESTSPVEESTSQAEESTLAVEESTFAAEESTLAVEESTFAVEESTFAAEESTFDVEESTFDVGKTDFRTKTNAGIRRTTGKRLIVKFFIKFSFYCNFLYYGKKRLVAQNSSGFIRYGGHRRGVSDGCTTRRYGYCR
jgi:hypothetical protein